MITQQKVFQSDSFNTNFISSSFSATERQDGEVEFSDPPKLAENSKVVEDSKLIKDKHLYKNNEVQQFISAEDLVLNID